MQNMDLGTLRAAFSAGSDAPEKSKDGRMDGTVHPPLCNALETYGSFY